MNVLFLEFHLKGWSLPLAARALQPVPAERPEFSATLTSKDKKETNTFVKKTTHRS